MSDENLRKYLRLALDEVVKKEKNRVSIILSDAEDSIAQGIKKMEPVMTAIRELKKEVGAVEGLEISPAEKGHMATIRAETSVTYDSLSVSTNFDNTAFQIEEFHSFSVDGSTIERKNEYETADDVMTVVIKMVGKHIGAQQAHNDMK